MLLSASPQARGLTRRPRWVGAVSFSRYPGPDQRCRTSYSKYPRFPRTARAASNRARGLQSAGMCPHPTHPPEWCPSGRGWPLPGKLLSFRPAPGSAPRLPPPPPALGQGAAPRARARTRACPGIWAAINGREVTSRRSWARVFCSRGQRPSPAAAIPADNAPALQLSACATR